VDGQDIKAILGKNIKKLRANRHYSQEKISEGLEVEIYELFRTDHIPNAAPLIASEHNKKLINRISKDITQKVLQAMETGFKKYIT